MSSKAILAVAAILCGSAASIHSHAEPVVEKSAAGSKDVTAAQVNGTWKCRKNMFKILALGNGKLQVDFDGVFEYKSSYGPMANIGQGQGIAIIAGDTAVFQPKGAEQDGKITMRFAGGKLIAAQEGTCGFGHRVYANGTYERTSSRKPKFAE